MAGGFVKQRGASWYVILTYRDPDTDTYRRDWISPKRGGFDNTERAAKRELARRVAALEEGERPGLARTPVAEWVARWITGRVRAKPSSRALYRDWLRLHIAPHIGHIPIGELTRTQVSEWHGKLLSGAPRTITGRHGDTTTLTRPISPVTLGKAHALLAWALGAALDDRIIRQNVAARTPPPAAPYRRPRAVWNADEQRRFLAAAADDEWGVLFRLMLTTGLRIGEALALEWDDVDLARARLFVRQAVSHDEQHQPILSSPKSATSRRVITLPESTVAALRHHHERQQFRRRAIGLVFRDRDGAPLTRGMARTQLARIIAAAGVPNLSLHGLRHTHATALMEQGVPLKVAQERLGHATPAFTAQMYQHVSDTLQDAAAQAIDAMLAGTDDTPPVANRVATP